MAIRDQFGEGCRCKPSGYNLNKIKKMNPVVYSVDCMCNDESAIRCDQIVICDLSAQRAGIYLIERKRNNPSMEVVGQLQSCARFVEKKLVQNEKFNFLPVLVSDKVRSTTFQQMKEKDICIHGNKKKIERIKTNDSLKIIKP